MAMTKTKKPAKKTTKPKERAEKAERERDEARAERDARPDISAEDAALVRDVSGLVGVSRVYRALMVHAAKAVRP